MKYTSREGYAAYGYGEMFQVSSELLVSAMVDNRAGQRQDGEQKKKDQDAGFEAIFQKTCENAWKK